MSFMINNPPTLVLGRKRGYFEGFMIKVAVKYNCNFFKVKKAVKLFK